MLQCSFLFIVKEIIIFMTSCKLVIGNYKGLYNANIWMSTALWGISGNASLLSLMQYSRSPVLLKPGSSRSSIAVLSQARV